MNDIYSSQSFEGAFAYTGKDLGANYTPQETTFRLWAPTADAVFVNLYTTGSDAENGAANLGRHAMNKDCCGTWVAAVSGDLRNVYYTYTVTRCGATVEACDPYAWAVGINGDRAMVVDLDSINPEGWENDSFTPVDNFTDAVIWELHVRDFSIDASSGVSQANRGKYLAFTEKGTVNSHGQATGIDYIKALGVNYVHLLPVYDIASVDEIKGGYNWGYDPKNYNVPEGSYATNAYDGNVRIREFKRMVKALHDENIGVIMDVVYNHVADAEKFCFNRIVPGYFSRIHADGSYQADSDCGNDTASERAMVRKYIVDSILHWVQEYHIDGFRWDLVGLIDYETINAVMAAVHEVNPNVVFYGEGWEMCSWTTKDGYVDKMTIQNNADKVEHFAFFNDTIRDLLKGSVFDNAEPGYVSGMVMNKSLKTRLEESFMGQSHWGSKNTVCPTPLQTVNYVSCHDNNTLFDRIVLAAPDASYADQVKMNNLAAAFYLTSQGIPFIHAGEEMLRSKPDGKGGFDHNSYSSGDGVNAIRWDLLANKAVLDTMEYYKGLIAFRKAHAALRMTDAAEVSTHVIPAETGDDSVMAFHILGGNGESSDGLFIAFNAKNEAVTVKLPEGKWEVHVNGEHSGNTALEIAEDTVTVAAIGAVMLVKTAKDA